MAESENENDEEVMFNASRGRLDRLRKRELIDFVMNLRRTHTNLTRASQEMEQNLFRAQQRVRELTRQVNHEDNPSDRPDGSVGDGEDENRSEDVDDDNADVSDAPTDDDEETEDEQVENEDVNNENNDDIQTLRQQTARISSSGSSSNRILELLRHKVNLKMLTKDNWYVWKNHAKVTFRLLGLESLVEGSRKKPKLSTSSMRQIRNWQADNDVAWYLLTQCIGNTHTSRVIRARENASKLYKSIEAYYNSRLESSRHCKKRIWENLKQTPQEPFEDYYQRWLQALEDALEAGEDIPLQDQIYTLMKSVLKKYAQELRTFRQLMSHHKVKVTLEEVANTLREVDIWEFDPFTSASPYGKGKGKNPAHHANAATIPTPKNGNGKKGKRKRLQDVKCYNCNKKGHISKNCPDPPSEATQKRRNTNNSQAGPSGTSSQPNRIPLRPDLFNRDQAPTRGEQVDFMELCAVSETQSTTLRAVIDSGTSRHMSPAFKYFFEYETLQQPRQIRLADNSVIYAEGYGKLFTRTQLDGIPQELVWENTLYVPNLSVALFSVPQITQQGLYVLFRQEDAYLISDTNPDVQFIYGLRGSSKLSVDVCWEFIINPDAGQAPPPRTSTGARSVHFDDEDVEVDTSA